MNCFQINGVWRTALKSTGAIAMLALFLVGSAHRSCAQSEGGIKAALIYNFAKFTEWPQKAFSDGNSPIVVGFVGAASLADVFGKIVTGKNANGRDFTVKKLTNATGAESCHIVFVGDAATAAAVLALVKGKPILTVGDNEAFASSGGMINFVKDGAKMSFDLDLKATTGAELKLDSKLRQAARTAKGE